jgi:hypothetical protein
VRIGKLLEERQWQDAQGPCENCAPSRLAPAIVDASTFAMPSLSRAAAQHAK